MAQAPPWFRVADRYMSRAVRSVRARRGERIVEQPVTLKSTAGYQLAAHIHRPAAGGKHPAVVLCPGIDDPGTVFDGEHAPVTADEVARLGCVVAHFDPAGRGSSWGEEDFGGHEHQDNVATVVRYLREQPCVDPDRIGILAISLGVAMAVGAAAEVGGAAPCPVAWVLDWEGPCDREIITAGGSKMAPAMGHSMTDEAYWAAREAVRHVGALTAGYLRLQSRVDHAQPGELRHATRMLDAAMAGGAAWVQLNDAPRGAWPVSDAWLAPGRLAANRAILRAVGGLIRQ
jgi:predicted acyl esterase